MKDEFLNKTKQIIDDVSELQKTSNQLNAELIDLKNKIKERDDQIKRNRDSITEEKKLSTYPPNSQGSIYFYNLLNDKFEYYDVHHFNNLTKFLVHIERLEKNYEEFYSKAISSYYKYPHYNSIKRVYSTYNELVDCYKLTFLLTSEINGDRVLYNKVYNLIEDKGLFLSKPEKESIDLQRQISGKLTNVISSLKGVFNELSTTNKLLSEQLNSLNTIKYGMDELSSEVSSLESSIDSSIDDLQSEIWGLKEEI
jgi:hypothetical protein